MGLFSVSDEAVKSLKEKGYSIQCFGETENTKNMSQFALLYNVSVTTKKLAEGFIEGTVFAAINDDLFEKGLVPASIKFLDGSASTKRVQVIAKRIN